MAPLPELRVMRLAPAQADAARGLRLAAGQQRYVGDMALNVGRALVEPRCDAMAIVLGDALVGFYRLDYALTVAARRWPGRAVVSLRSLALDRRVQGRGLGTRAVAACCADLERRRPARRLLLLNVHVDNRAAVRAYLGAGFTDTGELHQGGSAGPQHLLVRRLGVGECGS
ncbi:GNAT family N-acetyltransferase [Luteimonas sp. SJ-92]|uniref:GNAT family N-acetyltransferase n=1 Tax=Luteimonas salinisoli TaxID=2752307 RepID=A0A853J930_9GAMM|nr:GNAT family N-acetyltransferase [Luteimonas salinisoli]NZA25282.1 GNAT family N-acetyltransferase [Luteimonas salinisoli]